MKSGQTHLMSMLPPSMLCLPTDPQNHSHEPHWCRNPDSHVKVLLLRSHSSAGEVLSLLPFVTSATRQSRCCFHLPFLYSHPCQLRQYIPPAMCCCSGAVARLPPVYTAASIAKPLRPPQAAVRKLTQK